MARDRSSVIDYIMVGGRLSQDGVVRMRIEDDEGVSLLSDHTLVWIEFDEAVKVSEEMGREDGGKAWRGVSRDKWDTFREILESAWVEHSWDVKAKRVDRVERV